MAHPALFFCSPRTWTTIEQSGPTADQLKEQLETVCQMSPPEMKDQCDEAIAQIVVCLSFARDDSHVFKAPMLRVWLARALVYILGTHRIYL